MNARDQKIIQYCIVVLGAKLGDVVAKFGGQKFRNDLVAQFTANLEMRGITATKAESFQLGADACDWEEGRLILKDMIEFASNVAGKKVVENDVRILLGKIELKAGVSLYEEYFRLGLHKYLG